MSGGPVTFPRSWGDFPPNTTTPVTYTLSHPDYLFGATTYTQNARFCPQIDEGDLPDWDDHGGSDDEDDHDEYWCCFWVLGQSIPLARF